MVAKAKVQPNDVLSPNMAKFILLVTHTHKTAQKNPFQNWPEHGEPVMAGFAYVDYACFNGQANTPPPHHAHRVQH
jgi:hypothetical protein